MESPVWQTLSGHDLMVVLELFQRQSVKCCVGSPLKSLVLAESMRALLNRLQFMSTQLRQLMKVEIMSRGTPMAPPGFNDFW